MTQTGKSAPIKQNNNRGIQRRKFYIFCSEFQKGQGKRRNAKVNRFTFPPDFETN